MVLAYTRVLRAYDKKHNDPDRQIHQQSQNLRLPLRLPESMHRLWYMAPLRRDLARP